MRAADRAWQAAQELSQGFVYAYQTSLERAARRIGESALEGADPAALCPPPALPRHRRQAARVPSRALDPGQVDLPPSAVRPRGRARHRAAGRGPSERRAGRDALEHRAGICVRASDPAAQYRQSVARRDRLGERPDARVVPQAGVRGDPRGLGRVRRRSREQAGAPAPHRRRIGSDDALSRHDPARGPAGARHPRAAPGGDRRTGGRQRVEPAARRDPGKGASGRGAESARRSAPVSAHAGDGRGQGARRACPHLRRARSRRVGGAGQRRRCRHRAHRGVRGCRRSAHPAPCAGRARFAERVDRVVQRSRMGGQGSQRRGAAHRRVGRDRPEPGAGRARRRPAVRRRGLGAGRGPAPQQGVERRGRSRRVDHRRPHHSGHGPREARGEGRPRHRGQRRRRVDDGGAVRRPSTCRRRRARKSRSR